MNSNLKNYKEYGVLTEVSEQLNELFGDTSGRTISRRTTHGFKETFDLTIGDDVAEHIMHGGMAFSAYHLFSEFGNRAAGFLSLITLIALYQNGK